MSRPQVIDDQDHERIYERVAAIDVAKDTGMVCTRTPHPARPGARRATVWTVKARMGAVPEFRRGHGALYDALACGRIDGEALATLLASTLPQVTEGEEGRARGR